MASSDITHSQHQSDVPRSGEAQNNVVNESPAMADAANGCAVATTGCPGVAAVEYYGVYAPPAMGNSVVYLEPPAPV